MIPSLKEYEDFIYSLPQRYHEIQYSTLVFKTTSPSSAQVIGWLHFRNNVKLRLLETLDFRKKIIQDYSYEVWINNQKQYWYDCWPHPTIPELAETHPHHKHIQPDIKHHRIPAKQLSFNRPNLPYLIQEIIDNFLKN